MLEDLIRAWDASSARQMGSARRRAVGVDLYEDALELATAAVAAAPLTLDLR